MFVFRTQMHVPIRYVRVYDTCFWK